MLAVESNKEIALTKAQFAIYRCLCYFNIFSYPVRAEEIQEYCDIELSNEEFDPALQELLGSNLVHKALGYYSTNEDIAALISKRVHAENRFLRKLSKIRRFSSLVAKFPFVQFVGISGSCAKGLFDEEGDVDYFVIAKPGKLWLCRSLLILFKKVVLFNSRTYFCLNYFIDEENLEIPDKNIFVAHELLAIAPINNTALFQRFRKANGWANGFLPNKSDINISFTNSNLKKPLLSRGIEKVLSNALGEKLDAYFLKFTLATWRKRFPHLSEEDFEHRFRSTRKVSKHHPRGFQKKVLAELQSQLANITLLD
jgi:predicted nucleotidyltransferase